MLRLMGILIQIIYIPNLENIHFLLMNYDLRLFIFFFKFINYVTIIYH